MKRNSAFDHYYEKADPYQARTYFPEKLRLVRAWKWVRQQRYRAILDIGAGEGIWTIKLKDVSSFVVASDISYLALRRASMFYDDRMNYVVVDLANLPFSPHSFDLVTCMTSLGCLTEELRPQAIEMISQLLVPGGNLLLVDAILPGKFAPHEMDKLLFGKFKILKIGSGNLRIPFLGRLATWFPQVIGKFYEKLVILADRDPQKRSLHVLFWAQKI